jgi:hypothetical protein
MRTRLKWFRVVFGGGAQPSGSVSRELVHPLCPLTSKVEQLIQLIILLSRVCSRVPRTETFEAYHPRDLWACS